MLVKLLFDIPNYGNEMIKAMKAYEGKDAKIKEIIPNPFENYNLLVIIEVSPENLDKFFESTVYRVMEGRTGEMRIFRGRQPIDPTPQIGKIQLLNRYTRNY